MKQLKKIDKIGFQERAIDYMWWSLFTVFITAYVVLSQIYREQSMVVKLLIAIFALPFSVYLFTFTKLGHDFLKFLKAVRIEFLKIVWPKQDESNKITLLVIAAIAVIASILWLLDGLFYVLIRQVTG